MASPVPKDIRPMLSKLTPELPRGEGWIYEPKWDGFRAIAFVDGDDVDLFSRDRKPLARYFPELLPTLREGLPNRCVVDGEIVIAAEGSLDFDSLLQRIHPASSRVGMLAETTPSSFVAFDLLAIGDDDLREVPFAERRARLEDLIPTVLDRPPQQRGSSLWLTPQTTDPEEAIGWRDGLQALGIEGVIAKKSDLTYRPNERAMIKVKKRKTADCVVGGYRVAKDGDGIGSLLLGLYDDEGVLHYVGHTSSFRAAERRKLLAELQELRGDGFGGGRAPGGQSRWSQGRTQDWVSLRPERVCEVQFDKLQSGRFRHAATFVRWRDDREPSSCTFAQLS